MKGRLIVLFSSFITIVAPLAAQDLQYFFVDDVYQRSYINPALNNEKTVMLASGLSTNIGTDGPVYNDLISKNDDGRIILDSEKGLASMNAQNNIFGGATVHTIDASVDLKVFRVSAGHAWKANGFLQYSKDLAEIATYGNAPYIGQTKAIGPAYEYTNYNEIYIGIQKYVGPVSIGARVKRLSGVQAIQTANRKIDITTDEEFYALQVESDYTVNSAGTLDYFELDSFDISTQKFSFDHFMSGNGGWAFDVGASFDLGDRLELSLGILDLGSITWDKDAKTLKSKKNQTFDGIDLTSYIGTDDDILVEDSIRALLDFEETSGAFSSTLPSQMYLGARLQLSDMWTVGALLHTTNYQEKTRMALALNATTKWKILRLGVQYTARSEGFFNIGLNGALHIGPVIGFLTADNILAIPDPFGVKYASFRAGVSVSL